MIIVFRPYFASISYHFLVISSILSYAWLCTPLHYYLEHQNLCVGVITIQTLDDFSIRPSCAMSMNRSCGKLCVIFRIYIWFCLYFFLFGWCNCAQPIIVGIFIFENRVIFFLSSSRYQILTVLFHYREVKSRFFTSHKG